MKKILKLSDFNHIEFIIKSLTPIDTDIIYKDFCNENLVELKDKDMLDKIRYFKANMVDFKRFWDNKIKLGNSNTPNQNSSH